METFENEGITIQKRCRIISELFVQVFFPF